MAKKVEFDIELVKKFSFWVLVPLALLLVFIFNFLAVGTIGKKFSDRKNTLESTKNNVDKIRQEKTHPNNNTIDDVNVHTAELRGRFVTAWTTLEKDQRARNVWPEDVGADVLEEVSKLKFGDEISAGSLEKYLNFMGRHIPKLKARVNLKRIQINDGGEWKDKADSGGVDSLGSLRSGRGRMPDNRGGISVNNLEREVGIVEWSDPEIQKIIVWGVLPKSSEVWYAQEDLWVYDSLIWVIAQSNEGASSPHSAVVKRIESMLIGQQASRELASQLSVQTTGMGDDGMSSGGMPPRPPSMPPAGGGRSPMGGMGGIGGETGTAVSDEDIAKMKRHERYVDANNVPLSADAPSPFGEFNRMPICLKLVVDRQRIPEILVNCANCAMPIDVLSVRINPGAGNLAGNREGANRPVSPSPSMPAAGGGSDLGRQVAMDGSSGLDSIYGPNTVPIEIYGCINIFNPVDQNVAQRTNEPTP
ncbi:MAG: hypothetical protein LBL39_08150 [Planctomycetaceae bacterium]|jgi:hypothetical protein|nr:hypothetical protein [Planctomycetaceae bacterium]